MKKHYSHSTNHQFICVVIYAVSVLTVWGKLQLLTLTVVS